MATHLQLFANGSAVVDNLGSPVVFVNNAQGQSDASAFAISLIQQVDEVIKYRVAAKIGDSVAVSVDISAEQYNSDPIASISIDEGASKAYLNLYINDVKVIDQEIPYAIRELVEAVVESYPEYIPA